MITMTTQPTASKRLMGNLLLVGVLVLLGTSAAGDDLVDTRSAPDAVTEILPTLGQMLKLWEVEDFGSLAELIHPDGGRITLVRDGRPARSTSPAQAHYLFKSLFQQTSHHHLEVDSVTSDRDDAGVHAVISWNYRRGDLALRERVFVSLKPWNEGWRIVTIRASH